MDPTFTQTIRNTFGEGGEAWLAALPGLIAEACCRWDLTDIQPVPNLSYNYVAFAKSSVFQSLVPLGERSLVLKLGIPQKELTSEIDALRHFDGRSVVQLLEADPDKGILLLERIQPGNMLSELEDDERATHIAAEVMSQLWRPVPENRRDFIQLKDWFDGFKCLRGQYDGTTGPLPEKLVEMVESLSKELLSENGQEILLHGDFHHYNLLESARGWLAIDPKGVIGPKGYEVGPFLINPMGRFLSGSSPKIQTEKRIAVLAERLDLEAEYLRAWGICHALLSAWWSVSEKGDWRYAVRCAEIFQQAEV